MIERVDDTKVIASGNEIFVILPMTKTTGKIRLKRRNAFSEYGEPFAPRQSAIGLSTYIEWQIGFDLIQKTENSAKTSLSDMTFDNYKGETKYPYELSEIVYYSYKYGMISDSEIKKLIKQIKSVSDEELIENKKITRSIPIESKKIGRASCRERV